MGDGVQIWSKAYVAQRCEVGDGAIIGANANVLKGSVIGAGELWFNKEKTYATFQRMVSDIPVSSHFERVKRRFEARGNQE